MGNWEAKIYLNGEFKSSIKVKNGTELSYIRNSLNIDQTYCFISRNNGFIEVENNFTAKDAWKNDEEAGYKIDLMTREYYDIDRQGMVNLYFNMFRRKAIKYKSTMTLNEIMQQFNDNHYNESKNRSIIILNNYMSNEPDIFFLSKENIKIEDFRDLRAKDVVKFKDNGKRIDLVDSHYYKRFQVIQHLKELESCNNFNWLEQTEFFIKVKNLCGEDVTQAVIDELYNEKNRGIKENKEYIRRFTNLLMEEDRSQNSTGRNSDQYL